MHWLKSQSRLGLGLDSTSIELVEERSTQSRFHLVKNETTRRKLTVEASPDVCRFIKITYTNSASWYQRWIVYSFTVMTPSGEALYKVNGSMKKGPLKLSGDALDEGSGDTVDVTDTPVAEPSSTI